MGEILGAIQDAAKANPEQAKEFVAQIKAKWETLSPEEREQALQKLGEVKDKVAGLPEEQKTEIANLIRERAGV